MKVAPEVQQTGLLIVTGLVLAWFISRKAGQAVDTIAEKAGQVADTVAEKVNPASRENAVYDSLSWLGEDVTGEDDWSLGSWWYDVYNEDFADFADSYGVPAVERGIKQTAATVKEVVSTPANPIYQGANAVASAIAGKETTVGYVVGDIVETFSNWWN